MTADDPSNTIPLDPHDWNSIALHVVALEDATLDATTLDPWLRRWSDVQCQVWEARAVLKRERSRDVTVEHTDAAFQRFSNQIMAPFEAANARLATKLLALPPDMMPSRYGYIMRLLRQEATTHPAASVPIIARINAATSAYDARTAAMSTLLDGAEVREPDVDRRLESDDRNDRERFWHARMAPRVVAHAELSTLFLALLDHRRDLARVSTMPDVRSFQWRHLGILDYTASDALRLHNAIEHAIVPLAAQCWERRRMALEVPTVRPWDLRATIDAVPSPPFADVSSFADGMQAVFDHADVKLGEVFRRMRPAHLDLGWRKGKWPGGEEWAFYQSKIPYVLVGQDGSELGVRLLLHEMGHALHDALVMKQAASFFDYHYPDEMAEFAAIGLSYLALPSLVQVPGGLWTAADVVRITQRTLEDAIMHWLPQIARVDAFAHWVFAEAPANVTVADLDRSWYDLGRRFLPWIDWTGLEAEDALGWQHEWSLWRAPFYGLAYGVAHLAALDLWRSSELDRDGTWQRYRRALALGGTQPLPELFATAGVRLPFDAAVVEDVAAQAAARLGM